MKTDVLIVGGGPAGLMAANIVASKGLRTAIVDESWVLGGQLNQQIQIIDTLPSFFKPMRGLELAQVLIQQLEGFPVELYLEHTAVGVYKDGSIGLASNHGLKPIFSDYTVITTGASEEPIPFPGWTLPGVITIGAAQILINRERVLPGKSAVIIGSSDFALEVADQLYTVGVDVVAILEKDETLKSSRSNLIEKIRAKKIPIYKAVELIAAQGSEEVEKIVFRAGQDQYELDVDIICIDGGRAPILELLGILGCEFGYQPALGGWVPYYDYNFETNVNTVFVAGNGAGITNHGGILLTGAIVGINIAQRMSAVKEEEANELKRKWWRELSKLESSFIPDVWKSRREHIESYFQKYLQKKRLMWSPFS